MRSRGTRGETILIKRNTRKKTREGRKEKCRIEDEGKVQRESSSENGQGPHRAVVPMLMMMMMMMMYSTFQ
jgi:hypothetical protein